jgi:hypothetical protein
MAMLPCTMAWYDTVPVPVFVWRCCHVLLRGIRRTGIRTYAVPVFVHTGTVPVPVNITGEANIYIYKCI